MNKADIQQTGGFPLETDTLNFMQEAYSFLNNFGYLGGNSIIVRGCVENGNNVSNGVVFFNGELFEFRGGLKGPNVRIITELETREFENGATKVVYEKRYATFGSPGVPWVAFQRPRDLWNLTAQQDQIKPKVVPTGAIVMWAGPINQIPIGWKLCDGTNGTPDLRGRFIVGYSDGDEPYDAIGKQGGAEKVTLTTDQMPAHNHTGSAESAGSHTHSGTAAGPYSGTNLPGGGGFRGGDNDWKNRAVTLSPGGSHTHNLSIANSGGGQSHENRPPYFTLAYIQFKG